MEEFDTVIEMISTKHSKIISLLIDPKEEASCIFIFECANVENVDWWKSQAD